MQAMEDWGMFGEEAKKYGVLKAENVALREALEEFLESPDLEKTFFGSECRGCGQSYSDSHAYVDSHQSDNCSRFDCKLFKARAAIAKATGGKDDE